MVLRQVEALRPLRGKAARLAAAEAELAARDTAASALRAQVAELCAQAKRAEGAWSERAQEASLDGQLVDRAAAVRALQAEACPALCKSLRSPLL